MRHHCAADSLAGAEPSGVAYLEKRRVSDRAVPWKMSMTMLRMPSWPSRLFRKPTSEAARLPPDLTSRVFGALLGLPGSIWGHKRYQLTTAPDTRLVLLQDGIKSVVWAAHGSVGLRVSCVGQEGMPGSPDICMRPLLLSPAHLHHVVRTEATQPALGRQP